MKYCKKCLSPHTKPYIRFNHDGVCNACLAHETKQRSLDRINWKERGSEFDKIVQNAKVQKKPIYDALVPVSGGKDSITQVHRLLKYNLRILAVNVDYGIKTEIGHQNLNIVPEMGANLVIYRPELTLHKKLIRIGFEKFGDPDLLSHTLLHAFPLHVALNFDIPLVLLGENSAFEYGGENQLAQLPEINREWFSRYAANQDRDARYVSRNFHIPMEKLLLYDFPDDLNFSGTRAIFSSHFFYWDSETHLDIAKSYGFKTLNQPGEGTFRNYVGLDEKINRIHQYLKVLKFGYGRATDHACEDIRNGRITRDEAKDLIRRYDLLPPSDYFVDDFISFVGISRKRLFQILERYRNLEIWSRNKHGEWYIPGHLEDEK